MRRMYSKNQILNLMTYYIEHQDDFGDVLSTYIGDLISEAEISGSKIIDVNEIDFTSVDLVAKTLKQTQPNETATISVTSPASVSAGLTLTPILNKVEVINNILYIVAFNKIKNETAEAITFNYAKPILVDIDVSEETASKILDKNGDDLNVPTQVGVYISYGTSGGVVYGSSYYSCSGLLTNNGNKHMQLKVITNSPVSIEADGEVALEYRCFLTLI